MMKSHSYIQLKKSWLFHVNNKTKQEEFKKSFKWFPLVLFPSKDPRPESYL